MHCLSEKLISKILFSAKLHSSGIDFPYSTVVGTVTTINLGSAFEMPRGLPRLAVPHLCFAATKRSACHCYYTYNCMSWHTSLQKRKTDDTVL